LAFCSSCGENVSEEENYCTKCGHKITIKSNETSVKKLDQNNTLPKDEVVITKAKSLASQFQIAMGVIILLLAISIENYQNTFLGLLLLIIGFVGLKNKSKTVDHVLTIISLIIFGIALISLLG